jgi:hypothetical protein
MGAIRDAANAAFSDGPASSPSMPPKADIRAVFATIDQKVASIEAGYDVSYETRAQLFADLAWTAGKTGRVFGDATTAYRGVYKKSGASGAGSWTKIGELPEVSGLGALATKNTVATSDLNNEAVTLSKFQRIQNNVLLGRTLGGEGAAHYVGAVGGLEFVTGGAIQVANDGVTNAKLANMPEGTVKMRRRGVGAGDPTDTTIDNLAADLGFTRGDAKRPGDSPLSFTASLAGGDPASVVPLTVADTVEDSRGREVILSGSRPLIATREKFALEIGRKLRIRAVVQRRTNTPDPSGDAVHIRVGWYDRFKNALAGGAALTIIETLANLTVGSGAVSVEKVISLSAGDDVDFVAPTGAVYGVAYVYQYGTVPRTAVQVLDVQDITALQSYDPDLSALEGQVAGLISIDAGDRLDQLESAVGTPSLLRFDVLGNALAETDIPVGVDLIEVMAFANPGDGWHRFLKRSHVESTRQQKWQIDGAWWETGATAILMLFTGQSNTVVTKSYAWECPPNLWLWNGTTFVKPSETVIGTPVAAGWKAALENPDKDIHVVIAGGGGLSIDKFNGGLKRWKMDTGATVGAGISAGLLRLNNANPALATEMFMSYLDVNGNLQASLNGIFSELGYSIRIEKASDASVYLAYNVTGASFPPGVFARNITYTGGAGTIEDDAPLNIVFSTDVYALINANLPGALVGAGRDKPSLVAVWQGETGYLEPRYYVADWELFYDRLMGDGFIDETTPFVIYGINGTKNNPGDTAMGDFALYLQQVVQAKPNTRRFVALSSLPAAFWDDVFHPTAEGYLFAGYLGWQAFATGVGFCTPAGGIVVHPETGRSFQTGGTVAEPSIAWLGDADTGFYHAGVNRIGVAIGGVAAVTFGAEEDVDGLRWWRISNTVNGISSRAHAEVESNAGKLINFAHSILAGGFGGVTWSGASAMFISAVHAEGEIVFTAGGLVEKARLTASTFILAGAFVHRPPASAPALAANGDMTIEATNNTTLKFKLRGSDGVTRSGTIALA